MEQQSIANGGLQYVPQIAEQYVYLDFDGELTSYNGEILTVDNVEVQDSSLTEERIFNIVSALNEKYAAQNVIFVTTRPETAEYSTIYIGKTSAFDQYGNFAGLAETIDEGNQIKNDNAFVMLDSTSSDEAIINTISHETDHLLGTLDHGGEGLAAYAARYDITSGETSTGVVLSSYYDSMYISSGGVASETTVNDGIVYIKNGGAANDTTVNSGGDLRVSSGGTANSTTVNSGGGIRISSGGVANSTTVNSACSVQVYSGGIADTVLINKVGSAFVEDGGEIKNVTLQAPTHEEECRLTISNGGYGSNITNDGGFVVVYGRVCNVANSGVNATRYGGDVVISSGGFAKNLSVAGTGDIYVFSSGLAENVHVSSGGHLNAGNDDWSHLTQEKWGNVSSAVISSGGEFHIGFDGKIEDLTILHSGRGWVSSGGTADDVTVNSGGAIYVQSGGQASITFNPWQGTVYSSAGASVEYLERDANIYAGNNISGTIAKYDNIADWEVDSGVSALIFKDGVASNAAVSTSGVMHISSGGTARETTINSGGYMYISSGGAATSVDILTSGHLHVFNGGLVSTLHIADSANSAIIFSGGSAVDAVVEYGGQIFLSGGYGSNIIISGGAPNGWGGDLIINSGGHAENVTVDYYGDLYIEAEGSVNQATINSTGNLYIASGGTANSATVNSGGRTVINSGGNMLQTMINGGQVIIQSGNTLSGGSASCGGIFNNNLGSISAGSAVFAANSADDAGGAVYNNGLMLHSGGSFVNNSAVNGGGLWVYSHGTYQGSDVIFSGNSARNYGGAVCNNGEGANFILSGGSFVNNFAAHGGGGGLHRCRGEVLLSSVTFIQNSTGWLGGAIYNIDGTGGKMELTDVNFTSNTAQVNGAIFNQQTDLVCRNVIFSGNTAFENGAIGNAAGAIYISNSLFENNIVTRTYGGAITNNGSCVLSSVTFAGNSAVTSGGAILHQSGTMIIDQAIFFGNYVQTNAMGGAIYNQAEGIVSITDAGFKTVHDTIVNEGDMTFYGTVSLAGQLMTTRNISAEGTTIVFDISSYSAGNTVSIINDLSLISGAPNYAVTVNANQVSGTYKLAQGAENFEGTISIGDGTIDYGSIAVNGEILNYNNVDYKLIRDAGDLTLAIGDLTPAEITITGNVSEWTNNDVVLEVTVNEENCAIEYQIGSEEWQTYSNGVIVSENATVNFKATDLAGNVTTKEVVVDKIDKDAPTLEITGNAVDWTNSDVLLTAVSTDDRGATVYFKKAEDAEFAQYTGEITVTANGSYIFYAVDGVGNATAEQTIVVDKIDKVAPTIELATDVTTPTNGDVTLTATVSDGTVEYFADSKWNTGDSLTVNVNGTYQFRVTDTAGNVASKSIEVSNIDVIAPEAPAAAANITTLINEDVIITVTYSEDSKIKQYKIGNGEWQNYVAAFMVENNGTVYFRAKDAAGNESTSELVISNIDKTAPAIPGGFNETISGYDAKLDWSDASDTGIAGVKGYYVRYGTSDVLSGDGEFVTASEFDFADLAVGTYYYQVKTEDNAGNISEWSAIQSFDIVSGIVENLQGDSNGLSWDAIPGVAGYIVEYSTDNFANVISFETTSNKVDSIALPVGTYQWRVKVLDGEEVSNGENIISHQTVTEPQEYVSHADGNTDIFFVNANGKWTSGYAAQHTGILNGWSGTNEQVTLTGKNKLADIFEGSADANILLMTDDAQGDALFVDDIYTALPGTVAEQQARIAQIDEIRAGLGDDIIDMTSQRFAYIGDGVKIYGGLGNDTIWANNGNNTLFGDAGNDRIVGGSADDIIIGGSGNDSLHGGGGDDIFCFGENWGKDTVEQLVGGEITLWFESGSENNWNADTLTYTDDTNSVKVSGISTDNITLIFGDDSSSLYDELAAAGCFDDAASEKIFEEKGKEMLA